MRPALLAALVHLLLVPAAAAEIWQWTDEEGVIRYTPNPDRVPSNRRSTLVEVTLGGAPAPVAQTSDDEPEYLAPADEIGTDPFNAPQPARSVEVTDVPEPAWEVEGPPDAAAGKGSPETPTPGPSGSEEPAAGGALTADTPPVSSPPPAAVSAAAVAPAIPEPTAPATPGPAVPVTPEPAAPVTPESAKTVTTAAAAPLTPEPAAPVTPEPAAPVTPEPAAAATPAPPAPMTPEPAAAVAPAPAEAAAATAAAAGAASAPAPQARVDPWSSVAVTGAAAAPQASPPKRAELTAEQKARREELEEQIAKDEAALKRLLSDTELDAAGFEQSPELREIAMRLPALQAELRALEEGSDPEAEEAP